jgi:hypothetical protein
MIYYGESITYCGILVDYRKASKSYPLFESFRNDGRFSFYSVFGQYKNASFKDEYEMKRNFITNYEKDII